jgi:predicted site-specific integrase-resolvase
MSRQERDILERAVRAVSEQAAKADDLVGEAIAAGLDGSHRLTIHAKMLRLDSSR